MEPFLATNTVQLLVKEVKSVIKYLGEDLHSKISSLPSSSLLKVNIPSHSVQYDLDEVLSSSSCRPFAIICQTTCAMKISEDIK